MATKNKRSTLKIFFTRSVRNKLAKKGLSTNLKGKQIINNKIKLELPCDICDLQLSYPLQVGAFSYVGKNTYLGSSVKIGRLCSIASNVSIGITSHPMDRVSTSAVFYQKGFMPKFTKNIINQSDLQDFSNKKKVVIGNDVWIGVNAVIMPGIKIGDGAIIGANSVVTKDVKPSEIVGGVPAKLIRIRKPIKNQAFSLQKKIFDHLINKNDFPFLVGKDFIKYKSIFRLFYKILF